MFTHIRRMKLEWEGGREEKVLKQKREIKKKRWKELQDERRMGKKRDKEREGGLREERGEGRV